MTYLDIMRECGFDTVTKFQSGSIGNYDRESCRAAKELAKEKPSAASLVLALDAMDNDSGRPIREFSNLAAVSADRDDYARTILAIKSHKGTYTKAEIKEMAEERHTAKTLEKLNEMMLPENAKWQMRRRVVRKLRELGVAFNGATDIDNPTLWCAKEAATLIRSDRVFQSVAARKPEQGKINKPHHDQVHEDLRKYGIIK